MIYLPISVGSEVFQLLFFSEFLSKNANIRLKMLLTIKNCQCILFNLGHICEAFEMCSRPSSAQFRLMQILIIFFAQRSIMRSIIFSSFSPIFTFLFCSRSLTRKRSRACPRIFFIFFRPSLDICLKNYEVGMVLNVLIFARPPNRPLKVWWRVYFRRTSDPSFELLYG